MGVNKNKNFLKRQFIIYTVKSINKTGETRDPQLNSYKYMFYKQFFNLENKYLNRINGTSKKEILMFLPKLRKIAH